MSRPQLMHMVDDGIITGNVERNREDCGHCGHPTMCINIHHIVLPEAVGEPSNRLIAYATWIKSAHDQPEVTAIKFIGIGCGCYAKFHRQIAHITTRVQMSE